MADGIANAERRRAEVQKVFSQVSYPKRVIKVARSGRPLNLHLPLEAELRRVLKQSLFCLASFALLLTFSSLSVDDQFVVVQPTNYISLNCGPPKSRSKSVHNNTPEKRSDRKNQPGFAQSKSAPSLRLVPVLASFHEKILKPRKLSSGSIMNSMMTTLLQSSS